MAETYRVEVQMNAEPFAFDNSKPTILKKADIEKRIQQSGGRKKTTEKKSEKKSEKKAKKT